MKKVYLSPEAELIEINEKNDVITSSGGFYGDDLELGSLYVLPEFPSDVNDPNEDVE